MTKQNAHQRQRVSLRPIGLAVFIGCVSFSLLGGCAEPTETKAALAAEVFQKSVDGTTAESLKYDYIRDYLLPRHKEAVTYLKGLNKETENKPYPVFAFFTPDKKAGTNILWITWFSANADAVDVELLNSKDESIGKVKLEPDAFKNARVPSTGLAMGGLQMVSDEKAAKAAKLGKGEMAPIVIAGGGLIPKDSYFRLKSSGGLSEKKLIWPKPMGTDSQE